MSLWRKLNTLLKASSQAPFEVLVDTNAIQIFEQEIREAEQSVKNSKRELACVMAEKARLQRHNEAIKENLVNKENKARFALEKKEGDLALELAELIAVDEELLLEQEKQLTYLAKQESQLRQQLKSVVNTITRYRSELRIAKANHSAENAMKQLKGYSKGLNSHLDEMADSLNRIQENQQGFRDFDEALTSIELECSGQTLDNKLSDVGFNSGKRTGKLVLARLEEERIAAN